MVEFVDVLGWPSAALEDPSCDAGVFAGPGEGADAERSEASPSPRFDDDLGIFDGDANPFGTNGFLARLGEQVPFVNSGLQRLHELSGDEDALSRAQRVDPIGPDGYLTQVAEHIPVLNYVVQGVFTNLGNDRGLQRARERDPIGTDGYLTKVFEHIPVFSDGVAAVHELQGEDMAAERARAYSLQKMLSTDGALTRLVELMPVSNIIAAAVHEANGNREEAIRALNLVEGWAQAFKPDGAFAKVGELLPGPDALAFALHVQGGYYAQALRSLTKTSYVNVVADCVTLRGNCSSLEEFFCRQLEADGVAIQPRQFSLLLGLKDVLTNFLIVDREGHRRILRAKVDLERLGQGPGAWEVTQELLLSMVNDKITRQINRFVNNAPLHVDWLNQVLNNRLPDWQAESNFLRHALPYGLPAVPDAFIQAIQQALPRARISRQVLPPVDPIRLRRGQRRSAIVEATSGAACFAMLGGCSMGCHAGAALCAAGAACGVVELGRALVRRTAAWLDAWNIESWFDVTERPQPPGFWNHGQHTQAKDACFLRGAASSSTAQANTAQPAFACTEGSLPTGVVVEVLDQDAQVLGKHARSFYLDAIGAVRSSLLRAAEPALRALAWTTLETAEDVAFPLALEVDADAWEIELEDYSFNLQMPAMRFALMLHLGFSRGAPCTRRVFLVFPDALVDRVVTALEAQIPDWDLRELDPRFAGFKRTANVDLQLCLRWAGSDQLELQALSVRSRLDLPG